MLDIYLDEHNVQGFVAYTLRLDWMVFFQPYILLIVIYFPKGINWFVCAFLAETIVKLGIAWTIMHKKNVYMYAANKKQDAPKNTNAQVYSRYSLRTSGVTSAFTLLDLFPVYLSGYTEKNQNRFPFTLYGCVCENLFYSSSTSHASLPCPIRIHSMAATGDWLSAAVWEKKDSTTVLWFCSWRNPSEKLL